MIVRVQSRGDELEQARRLTREVWGRLASNGTPARLVGFECGRVVPLLLGGGDTDPIEMLGTGLSHAIIAPILEQFPANSVRFVVLLTDGLILDQRDWEEDWSKIGVACAPGGVATPAGWTRVPANHPAEAIARAIAALVTRDRR
jgi:hypothetical protein